MARPRKKIDSEQVTKLAAINCSYEEMAAVLGCNESTLTRRFAQAIKKGRSQGRMSLKRKQFELATNGNVAMLIFLGKVLLGYREEREPGVTINNPPAAAIDPETAAALKEIKELLEAKDRCSAQNSPPALVPQVGLLARS